MILVNLLGVNLCIYKITLLMIYKVKDHLDQINLKIGIYNGSLDQWLVY
jgi:hypothetical protein